jgi:RNA polymerase sigma-70 factor (ECF subfamily)
MNTTPISLLEQLKHSPGPASWQRFADLYTPLLLFWARRLGLQHADAADLVQDLLLKLMHKLPAFTYDQARRFRGWLRTVLLNEWRTHARRKVPVTTADGLDAVPDDPGDDFGEAEYCQYVAERALRLMQAQFQPNTWRACWLQVVEGRTAAEAAAVLGITEAAAYVAKSRVLRRLRKELDGLLS